MHAPHPQNQSTRNNRNISWI